MKGWSLVAVPVLLFGAIVVGCSSGDTPIPKVAIASGLTGTSDATQCRLSTVTSTMEPAGMGVLGIGSTNSLTIQDGSNWLGGTVRFTCAIIPKGDGSFKVSGRAELQGVTQGKTGTFNLVSGTFRPKVAGMPNPEANDVFATLTSINGALTQMNCIGTYDGMDQSANRCTTASEVCTQNNTMDLKPPTEDSKSAAIWGTIFCSAAADASQNPPRTCKTAITFRFENCPTEIKN